MSSEVSTSSCPGVQVTFQYVTGFRHVTTLPARCTVRQQLPQPVGSFDVERHSSTRATRAAPIRTPVKEVEAAAREAFEAPTTAGVTVVLHGKPLPLEMPDHVVTFKEGGG